MYRLSTRMAEGRSVEPTLALLVEKARAAWPTLRFDADEFSRYVAARIPSGQEAEATLAEVRAGDLLLAFACSRGDAEALARFEDAYFADLVMILARMTRERDVVEEVTQTLRTKLFLARGDAAPKIVEYSGRGDLRGWFRVTATRHAISTLRKPRRETEDDGLLSLVPAAAADPEMRYLLELYRDEFRRAFAEAVEALSSEERNLLRYHYVDRLNIDEIGAIHGIHRVSAARRLTKVRAGLVDAVRRHLQARLRVGTTELQSILRLVRSQVHISLRAVLDGSDRKK